ncbi:DUF302 domain-containing protein (plasmid) [Arthrobacter sp. TES]|uniref:Uncharacterized conserved protein, DUF302 family n=1 Tax=Crystallibacter crystallopoietes TaxID=37928 RepID=A0A1H0XLV7_9MICC|nr:MULTISPECIES: DUF302 domain-containing protein [Micrococcaceae]QOI65905.1 DUF302 domain-containing protein [Arthrobacter sp. TES]MCY0975513.1 DUF302 domain-containing protein [Paenarthrobacter ureafaciens]UOD83527.1 DUF302 domain-containing protein [Paenarthrobacter ureafaciens]WOC63341.1 DUF302 domain-containing protein [Paenarthrobacter sp. AT5]SDQ03789.1 Uncharacterized conserved protein, DUF302 family [Arthrobacter crystallopoietes]
MTYTLTATVDLPWTEALDRTRDALSAQGFGILTEINVRSTFEAKLGAEAADAVGDYVILGACNPALASRALPAEPEIGALLPCNVVVRRNKDAAVTTIEAIDPQTMVQLSETPAVKEVADDAGTRLRAALAGLNEATE